MNNVDIQKLNTFFVNEAENEGENKEVKKHTDFAFHLFNIDSFRDRNYNTVLELVRFFHQGNSFPIFLMSLIVVLLIRLEEHEIDKENHGHER